MKKLLSILVIVIAVSSAYSQTQKTKSLMSEIEGQWGIDENRNLTYQKIVDMADINKDVLYQRAENYFIYNYASGKDVIQTKDKDQGLIIGKGYWPSVYMGITLGSMTYSAYHILRVDVKEGKARITLTVQNYDVVYSYNNTTNEFPLALANAFPINENSASKTMEGKAFYALHFKCIATLESLINSLKNDAVPTTKNDNW